MELNQTFNFSLNEAYLILLEHKKADRNLDPTAEGLLIGVYGLLMLAGISANLLVSFVVARRPTMHTPRNLYIVNLTVSDLTLCLVCMPFTLVVILRRQWSLGLVLCKLVPALQGTNIMVSVGTITVIALDRYFTIVRTQERHNERRRVIVSIILVWLFSFLATLPVLFYQVVEPFTFQRLVLYETCIERWPSRELKISYAVGLLLVQAVIPALVVAVVHARIASHLNKHARTQTDSRRAHRELNRNRRTTVLLSGIAVLFAVSWLPLGVFSLWADMMFSADEDEEGMAVIVGEAGEGGSQDPGISPRSLYLALAACHVTAMSSAVSNPVVYGFLNSNIRRELCQLMPAGGWCPGRAGDQGRGGPPGPSTHRTTLVPPESRNGHGVLTETPNRPNDRIVLTSTDACTQL